MHSIFVFKPVVSFFFVIFIPHTLKAGPIKILSYMKPVHGAKRFGTAALDDSVLHLLYVNRFLIITTNCGIFVS